MGGYQYRPGMKRKNRGHGQDFRWKKAKLERRLEKDEREMMSGDALENEVNPNDPVSASQEGKNEPISSVKRRQREAKRRRREQHEQEREQSDKLIREAPHKYLWSQYREWAGSMISDKDVEEWSEEQVTVLEDDGGSLMPQVKAILGDDYVSRGGYEGGTPGVAVIALAASAVNAVGLAKRMYDGCPVGKLFSKHVKIHEQKEWLRRACRKGLAPSAAGTSKRVQRLVEDGEMTFDHTVGLVIDMSRDMRLMNIVDMHSTKAELFELIHKQLVAIIASGKMKVILCIPKAQATKLEDVRDELMKRMSNARKKNAGKKSQAAGTDDEE